MFTIELDCAPGFARPDAYIGQVLEAAELAESEARLVGQFFGNWTWEIDAEAAEKYAANRDKAKAVVVALYNSGAIRYGSW